MADCSGSGSGPVGRALGTLPPSMCACACVVHAHCTRRPGFSIWGDCKLRDVLFSLLIFICHLLKSFRVMKNTKVSTDFGVQTQGEQSWGQKPSLSLKIPDCVIIRDVEADRNGRICFILT